MLLVVLPFPDKLINDVEVTVKIESSGFVMQVGTSLALIEKFKGLDRLNVKLPSQFHRNGTDAVAQDDFLNNRRFDRVIILLRFHHKSSICL